MKTSPTKAPATQKSATPQDNSGEPELLDWVHQQLKTSEAPTKGPLSDADTRLLLHQLQVHQIELEMQNEELRESRLLAESLLARYTDLFDFAPAGLFSIEKNGTLSEVNLAGARMLGAERSQLTGKRFAAFVASSERTAFNAFITQAFASDLAQTCELTLERPGHAPLCVTLEATRTADAKRCHLVLMDITARVQAERVLAENEARTSAIIESAMDAIITVDDATRIVVFNQAAASMFGCAAIDAIGQPLERFIPKRFRAQHKAHIRAFGQSGITSRSMGQPGHVDALRANGEEFPVEAAISHAAVFGRQFYTVILRDITQSKLAREKLELSQRQLRASSKAASEALEAERTRIAREMHDEFGQLLTAMKMDLETVIHGLRPDQPEPLVRALAMSASIDELVTAARRLASDLRPLILDDLGLGAALEWLTQSFSKRVGIAVKLTVDEALVQIPEPFASTLYRTAQESLTNIARHAQASMVVMRLERDGEYVQLTVRDNGRGIELAELAKRGSYGLLGIRERMELMGGTLAISRNAKQGTQLRARVPLTLPPDDSKY
jgi:PAS domain S-box-containing protein